ncbi:T9SS type A sorting domain-containing protein [Flavobacterium sp.]|jgi:hypothetical protein|uniref:T9SS type A sorting domain-containing protein n=1 Tax=Flavobacterium sp. TaxID=239 RepID=UPI0037BF72FB
MKTKFLNYSVNKLMLIGFLFQVTNVVGQITVTENGFIYVSNDVLFTTEDIILADNSSKIYLRNEAQLLQKGIDNNNQGIGQISVYQNNNVHEYAYNFWCSPVGNTTNSVINNPFKVNQIHDPLLNTSNPIDSQPALFTTGGQGLSTPLTIAKSWLNIFQAGNSLSNWSNVGDTGNIPPGLGFTMKGTSGSNSNQTYDFRGKPNNGTISNTVLASQWTLIGNPYPSALDALEFIHDSENVNAITGTLYFWQQDLSVLSHNIQDYVGGYASYTISQDGTIETFIPAPFNTYNNNGQINNNGNTLTNLTTKKVKRYLPIGQGFMVEGKTGTTGIVKTKNSHREYYKESNSESEFFRTNQTVSNIPSEYSRFRLNIDFNNTYTRQLVQTFHENATSGFDYGLESKSNNPLSNDANWLQQNIGLTSQASVFNENLVLPLKLNLSTNSLVRFRVVAIENIASNQPIFLYDALTGVYYNLTTTMPEISLVAGIYQNRFDIRFTSSALSNNTNLEATNSFLVTYQKNNEEIVLLNHEKLYINSLDLIDLSGKLIFSNKINSNSGQFKIPVDNIAKGVYIANIKSTNLMSKIKLIIY